MYLRNLIAISILALAPVLAHADSFTYTLNDNFASFSVTGTITTDSNSGSLATGDITAYNIFLNDGSNSLNLTQSNSQDVVAGNALTATASGLFFNFGSYFGSLFAIQSPFLGAGTNYLCYQGQAGGCDNYRGAHESIDIGWDGPQTQQLCGNQQIASATAVTPEPESLVLFGTGILGLAGVARRKLIG